MSEYIGLFVAKVEKILLGEMSIVYIEFFDGGRNLIQINESIKNVKEGDKVVVGRKLISPPFMTKETTSHLVSKDEIIKVLEKEDEKIYEEIRNSYKEERRGTEAPKRMFG